MLYKCFKVFYAVYLIIIGWHAEFITAFYIKFLTNIFWSIHSKIQALFSEFDSFFIMKIYLFTFLYTLYNSFYNLILIYKKTKIILLQKIKKYFIYIHKDTNII